MNRLNDDEKVAFIRLMRRCDAIYAAWLGTFQRCPVMSTTTKTTIKTVWMTKENREAAASPFLLIMCNTMKTEQSNTAEPHGLPCARYIFSPLSIGCH